MLFKQKVNEKLHLKYFVMFLRSVTVKEPYAFFSMYDVDVDLYDKSSHIYFLNDFSVLKDSFQILFIL